MLSIFLAYNLMRMNKLFLKARWLIVLQATPILVMAASENVAPYFYTKFIFNLLGIIGAVVVFAALIMLVRILNQLTRLQEIQIYKERGWEHHLEAQKVNQESWFTKIYKKLTAAVPIEKEEDILLNHDYDGIQELDNNLPPWWVYGFYLTIGIAIFYVGFYHFSEHAMSTAELYALEMEQSEAAVERYLATQANKVDESNAVMITDAVELAEGQGVFETYCAACHMKSGGGAPNSVGPNLTDKYWLHGGGMKNVFKTIKYGVPEKGMISWKDQLRPTEIHKVASYILSLQNTNPPNAKAPQGDLYEDTAEASDSLSVISSK